MHKPIPLPYPQRPTTQLWRLCLLAPLIAYHQVIHHKKQYIYNIFHDTFDVKWLPSLQHTNDSELYLIPVSNDPNSAYRVINYEI